MSALQLAASLLEHKSTKRFWEAGRGARREARRQDHVTDLKRSVRSRLKISMTSSRILHLTASHLIQLLQLICSHLYVPQCAVAAPSDIPPSFLLKPLVSAHLYRTYCSPLVFPLRRPTTTRNGQAQETFYSHGVARRDHRSNSASATRLDRNSAATAETSSKLEEKLSARHWLDQSRSKCQCSRRPQCLARIA